MKKIINCFISILVICLIVSCASKNNVENKGLENNSSLRVYRGSAEGYNGRIEVDVYIENDIMTDVIVVNHSETPGIGGPLTNEEGRILNTYGESPITVIPKMIVDNQTVNVDAVSGATATSYGILHAVTDALVKGSYEIDAVSSPTENTQKNYAPKKVDIAEDRKKLLDKWLVKANYETEIEDRECDVLVIGGGGAGLAAAISASENGSHVVVVEKNGELGGDTLVCGAIYNSPDNKLQNEIPMTKIKEDVIKKALDEKPINTEHEELINIVKSQLEEHNKSSNTNLFDSKEWFALQTYNGGDKKANLSLVKTLCFNSHDGLEWIKNIGVSFYNFISQGAGSLWERTHTNTSPMGTGFISNYIERIENDSNIKILTNTTCQSVEKDESGRVSYANCTDKYGNEFKIHASKGVILATGGFSANKDMLKTYNIEGQSKWSDVDIENLPTTNRKTVSIGSGITMGVEVGADLFGMSDIQLLYLGNPKNGELTKYPPRCVNGTDQVIFINKNGERFTNEGGRRDDICLDILNQPDKIFYILESGDGDKYVDIYSSEFMSADGFSLDYLVENGYIVIGDTIEELAVKLDMNPDTLQKTIEGFNECVDGKEDIYGRSLYSIKLENGPFVATKRQVSVHHTMGGLKIDEKGCVLDKDGNVIAGLFAAGEVTGGIHGGNRLGGNAVVDTVVFGKIAGESAAKNDNR